MPEQVELANMSNEQAAEWLIATAPVELTGFGANFFAAVAELRDADVTVARERVAAQARATFTELREQLEAGAKAATYTECITLVDDAVALREDPKGAIVRERDKPVP